MTSYPPPQPTKYLYVDGAYLRERFTQWGQLLGLPVLPIDFSNLKRGFLRTYYYDAEPEQKQGEAATDYQTRLGSYQSLRENLRSIDCLHVREGVIRGAKKQRQKAVDVLLAVDMLSHSMRRTFERVTLLAGDLDFLPLVNEVVDAGIIVTIWAELRTAAKELLDAADSKMGLNFVSAFGLCSAEFRNNYGGGAHSNRQPMQDLRNHGRKRDGDKNADIGIYQWRGATYLITSERGGDGKAEGLNVESDTENALLFLRAVAKADFDLKLEATS